jgi:hypothetical protein
VCCVSAHLVQFHARQWQRLVRNLLLTFQCLAVDETILVASDISPKSVNSGSCAAS